MKAAVCGFVVGASMLQLLPMLPAWPVAIVAAVLLVALVRHRAAWFVALGFLWMLGASLERLAERLPPVLEGRDLTVEGVVAGLPQRFERGVRFDFAVTSDVLPSLIRLSWYHNPAPVRAGQRWRFRLRLKRPHGMMNPGGFDYERWLFLQGVGATGYVRRWSGNQLLAADAGSRLMLWRQRLAERLDDVLEDRPAAAIVRALTIGDRSRMRPEQWRVLRRTGTAHLMAISGLHIGLAAGLCFFLLRWLWPSIGVTRCSPVAVAALGGVSSALLYAGVAGWSIPTRRAVIMVSVVMGALLLQRAVRPFHGLAVAMLLIVLLDPFAVLSAGFWLSCVAVALIIYVMGGRVGTIGNWRSGVRIQWAMAVGLTPVVLFYFQQASLVAPVANLVAVPVVGLLVVPLALTGLLLLQVLPEVGQWALIAAETVLDWLLVLLRFLSDLPFAQWDHAAPTLWILPMTCVGALLLLSPRGTPARWLAVVLVTPLLFAPVPRPRVGEVWLTVLDVGQGLSAVVQTARHVLVFDAGARYSARFDMGEAVVAPFLRSQAMAAIDRLVVSHGDNDHIGGVDSLVRSFEVDSILSSVPERLSYPGTIACRAGQSWSWDGVSFGILSPMEPLLMSENDNSCVLRVSTRSGTLLLTGDLERAAEARLVARYGSTLDSDVLVVAHHGSRSSSIPIILQAVTPRYALIPAGYRNRYGFPDAAVIERLKAIGATPLTTADLGAIQVVVDRSHGVLPPSAFRYRAGRYYHRYD